MMGSMMRRGSFGDGATLDLDFTSMTSTSDLTAAGLTFTRSTSGTRINASGLLEVVGSNVARFDHDFGTGTRKGLLIEGPASNLVCHSETFATSGGTNNWTRTNGTLGAPIFEDPEGTFTAPNWTATSANATLLNNTALASASRTFSVYIKGVTVTGSVQLTMDNVTWTTVTVTTSWARYQVTGTSTGHVGIRLTASGDTVHVFAAQLEAGSGASSYIPTGSSTENRAADSCVMTGTNFSSWFAGATEGVFFSEYEAPRSLLGSADYFCLATQYSAGAFIGMSLSNANRYPQALISPGGGLRISGGINVAATTPMKHAAKWSGVNNVLVIANGIVGASHAATTGTPSLTMFSIGSSSLSGTAATGDYLNGCVRRVKFWPTALSNATIQALTS